MRLLFPLGACEWPCSWIINQSQQGFSHVFITILVSIQLWADIYQIQAWVNRNKGLERFHCLHKETNKWRNGYACRSAQCSRYTESAGCANHTGVSSCNIPLITVATVETSEQNFNPSTLIKLQLQSIDNRSSPVNMPWCPPAGHQTSNPWFYNHHEWN